MINDTSLINIFIIDDDKLLRTAIKEEIRKTFHDFELHIFTFELVGQLKIMLENKPDIALVDYHLNGEYPDAYNGIHIIDLIKEHSPETEIILFTGEESMGLATEAFNHGASDYVVKNSYLFRRLNLALLQCFKLRELKKELSLQKQRNTLAFFAIGVLLAAITLIQLFAPHLLK